MKIVSWNVNSIRSRLEHVTQWLESEKPDLLCLQETKVTNEDFPRDVFDKIGLKSYIHGQKSYNGVAFITPHHLDNVSTGFIDGDLLDQKRVIRTHLNGINVIHIYAPQGQEVGSEKFDFKRAFYAELLRLLEEQYDASKPLIILGDFNIAPTEKDVDDVKKRSGRCMFTQEEHGWLQKLYDWGLTDALRTQTQEEHLFTWWDYRAGAVPQNRGLRIDLMLMTPSAIQKLKAMEIHREERLKDAPSDHVPVVAILD